MYDTGLATERTDLAWQRTALSLFLCSAMLLRIGVEELGGEAVLGAGIALVLAGYVYFARRAGRSGTSRRDGRSGALLVAGVILLTLTEFVVVVRG